MFFFLYDVRAIALVWYNRIPSGCLGIPLYHTQGTVRTHPRNTKPKYYKVLKLNLIINTLTHFNIADAFNSPNIARAVMDVSS